MTDAANEVENLEGQSVKVSVIVTVLNEGPVLERLLESLAGQSRPPDEVVIVDGGSTDGTLAALQAWAVTGRLPLVVVQEPGANISQGRNAAVAAASGEVIVSTDAGVRLEPGWLAALVAPLEAAGAAGASGWFVADAHTAFEVAMGATVLPHLREIKPQTFMPSSRSVAFRREAWQAVGGYPEWLDYCEDLVFDLNLRQRYGPFPFAPEARAHFRPRSNLRDFFKQYYRYARGDGKADLWRRRHAIRYAIYLVVAPGLATLAVVHSPWWWLALLGGAAAYLATPYHRLAPMLAPFGLVARFQAALLVPVIRVVGDVAKMVGYPVGRAWRRRNWQRREVHWR